MKEVKKNKYYLLLMESLPDMIESESARNQALEILNDLLADKSFNDKELRKQCIDIRKFLLLNQMPFLQFLTANKETLHNMTLFPHAYPDNVLDDIVKNTFYLVVPGSRRGRIGVSWNQIRKNEGEGQIIVTLINSSQLSKLSPDFREYLYVRALFLGVDPAVLSKRFARASGLSLEKINDLSRIARYFEPEEDDEDVR